MPSVKIPKKSTDFDMTPFVDVAFLILSFFMLATKFKPPEPVDIKTPSSVSADKLKMEDALLIEIDTMGRVFFTLNLQQDPDNLKQRIIQNMSNTRGLGLGPAEINAFIKHPTVGSPMSQLKTVLATENKTLGTAATTGVPVDSTNNELDFWIRDAVYLLQAREDVQVMIKADNNTKYPAFKSVVETLRKNNQMKYQLITTPEGVPAGTELYRRMQQGRIE
jgi:biopolymer transport protein ExbD